MVSSFTGVCDAVISDLQNNVRALTGESVIVHRYAPWDPEQLMSAGGERHLAVWPAAEAADAAQAIVTGPGGDMLIQVYRVLYWEDASDESTRGVVDETAASDLLALLESVRARFYEIDNLRLGGTDYTRYVGASLPERSGHVRWFQITFQVRTALVAT